MTGSPSPRPRPGSGPRRSRACAGAAAVARPPGWPLRTARLAWWWARSRSRRRPSVSGPAPGAEEAVDRRGDPAGGRLAAEDELVQDPGLLLSGEAKARADRRDRLGGLGDRPSRLLLQARNQLPQVVRLQPLSHRVAGFGGHQLAGLAQRVKTGLDQSLLQPGTEVDLA